MIYIHPIQSDRNITFILNQVQIYSSMRKKNLTLSASNYQQIERLVYEWDINSRLVEKMPSWKLKISLTKLSTNWINLTIHSLLYFLLKNFSWIISEDPLPIVISHNYQMKYYYLLINASTLSKEQFDLHTIVVTKLIAYFIGYHFPTLCIDHQFEAEVYITIFSSILGIFLHPKTYKLVLNNLKSKYQLNKERQSFQLDQNEIIEQPIRTAHNLQRRVAKNQKTIFLKQIQQLNQYKTQQLKKELKESLFVNLKNVKIKRKATLAQIEERFNIPNMNDSKEQSCTSTPNSTLKKSNYSSNKLSSAAKLFSDTDLIAVKQFPIKYTTLKKTSTIEIKKIKDMAKNQNKVQIHKIQEKKTEEKKTNWSKIIENMRAQIHGQSSILKKVKRHQTQSHIYDSNKQNVILNNQYRQESRSQNQKLNKSIHEGSIKQISFKKLQNSNISLICMGQNKSNDSIDQNLDMKNNLRKVNLKKKLFQVRLKQNEVKFPKI